jgi:hypothetical protein
MCWQCGHKIPVLRFPSRASIVFHDLIRTFLFYLEISHTSGWRVPEVCPFIHRPGNSISPCSGPAPDSSSRPGGILAILAANKRDHPGTSYRALKDQKKGSLSMLLAADRAQAAPEPLPAGVMLSEATITRANAAIGSMAGVVRAEKGEGLGVLRPGGGAISGAREGEVRECLRDSEAGGGVGGRENEIGASSARFEGNGAEIGGEARNGQSGADSIEDLRGVKGGTSRSHVTLEPSGSDAALGLRGVHKQGLGLSGANGVDGHTQGSADVSRGDRVDDRRRKEATVRGGALVPNGKAGIASGKGPSKDAQSMEMKKRANAMEFLKQVTRRTGSRSLIFSLSSHSGDSGLSGLWTMRESVRPF